MKLTFSLLALAVLACAPALAQKKGADGLPQRPDATGIAEIDNYTDQSFGLLDKVVNIRSEVRSIAEATHADAEEIKAGRKSAADVAGAVEARKKRLNELEAEAKSLKPQAEGLVTRGTEITANIGGVAKGVSPTKLPAIKKAATSSLDAAKASVEMTTQLPTDIQAALTELAAIAK